MVFRNIVFDTLLLEVNFRYENLCFTFFTRSGGTKILYFIDLTFVLISLMVKW